jgi:tripartite-type tricarboxylate transporter receptor subunit TctC
LAVTTGNRSSLMPALPTMAEAGVPGFEATTWHGVVVPASTSPEIIRQLNGAINAALNAPDLKDQLAALGAEVRTGTPQEFAAYIAAEIPKWSKIVRESGARAE